MMPFESGFMLQKAAVKDYEMITVGRWTEVRKKGETKGQWITSDTTMEIEV